LHCSNLPRYQQPKRPQSTWTQSQNITAWSLHGSTRQARQIDPMHDNRARLDPCHCLQVTHLAYQRAVCIHPPCSQSDIVYRRHSPTNGFLGSSAQCALPLQLALDPQHVTYRIRKKPLRASKLQKHMPDRDDGILCQSAMTYTYPTTSSLL
jgi:hypothetical protein